MTNDDELFFSVVPFVLCFTAGWGKRIRRRSSLSSPLSPDIHPPVRYRSKSRWSHADADFMANEEQSGWLCNSSRCTAAGGGVDSGVCLCLHDCLSPSSSCEWGKEEEKQRSAGGSLLFPAAFRRTNAFPRVLCRMKQWDSSIIAIAARLYFIDFSCFPVTPCASSSKSLSAAFFGWGINVFFPSHSFRSFSQSNSVPCAYEQSFFPCNRDTLVPHPLDCTQACHNYAGITIPEDISLCTRASCFVFSVCCLFFLVLTAREQYFGCIAISSNQSAATKSVILQPKKKSIT